MTSLQLTYPAVLSHLKHHLVEGRTETRAFLAWFLENFYRLEESEAQDAVCDGPDDKGVDGIYVDENLERVEVLQSKLYQNARKKLGDSALKEFAGTIEQFRDPQNVENIAKSTSNQELSRLIADTHLADKISAGFEVRGIFLTNVSADGNASSYLASRSDLVVYDAPALQKGYIATVPTGPIKTPATFDVAGYDVIEYRTPGAKAFVAPLLAAELVRLDGLGSGELFAWNVRQSLGRTRVNKAIASSVRSQSEHKNFLLYHNGLTVLCERLKHVGDKIEIAGYNVVNGCQSLTTLFENKATISNELRVLTRVIELPADSDLAAKITRHSNNQNAISARDLQSNSNLQRRLQREIEQQFKSTFFYEIKRGEHGSAATTIPNEEAARILLAFDLSQPWTCHQTYKLFDELHSDIFGRPEVNGARVVALYQVYESVIDVIPQLKHRLMAGYRLTQFFMLYLLRRALEVDQAGRGFVKDPGPYLGQKNGLLRIRRCCRAVLSDLIIDVNAELEDRAANGLPVDYKRELKSPGAVKTLAQAVVPMYEKAARRGRINTFEAEWQQTA